MHELTAIFPQMRRQLFPMLKEEIGPLSELDRQIYEVIARTNLGRFPVPFEWRGNGCQPHARVWLAHAFIAKAFASCRRPPLQGQASRPMATSARPPRHRQRSRARRHRRIIRPHQTLRHKLGHLDARAGRERTIRRDPDQD